MMYAIYCIKDDTIFNKTDDKKAVIEKCNQLNKDLMDYHGAKEPWYKAVEINVIGELQPCYPEFGCTDFERKEESDVLIMRERLQQLIDTNEFEFLKTMLKTMSEEDIWKFAFAIFYLFSEREERTRHCKDCKYYGEVLKDNLHSCNNDKSIFKTCLETATSCEKFEPKTVHCKDCKWRKDIDEVLAWKVSALLVMYAQIESEDKE